jgi:hypothetical protein
MYEGATENDPLLRATTIKYEQRYAHQQWTLRRSIFILLVSLGVIFLLDIIRLILRRDSYDPGNGNMLPQAIMVVLLGAFVVVFNKREKTTVLAVVYITVLVLFFFFSLAILPSFIKEIIIDYDVLCPVLIGLTGVNACICIYCISTAYRFLKFHRKYTKRKATLPAVLHSSPQWQNFSAQRSSDDFASVLFPSQELDTRIIQEQWERFQQSRLYLPENNPPQVPPLRRLPPPSGGGSASTTSPPPTPGMRPDPERWERFQRSPYFSVNNMATDLPPQPSNRARRNTTKEAPRFAGPEPAKQPEMPQIAQNRLRASSPIPPPPPPTNPIHPPSPGDASEPPPQEVLAHGSPRMGKTPLVRNPSFRYGAYVHEPTQFRAHPDDTPQEYTRLAQGNRGESLPNLHDSQQLPTLAPRQDPRDSQHPRVELESFGAESDGEEEQEEARGTAPNNDETRKERRLSLPTHVSPDIAHARAIGAGATQRFKSQFTPGITYADSPRLEDASIQPHLRPKIDRVIE